MLLALTLFLAAFLGDWLTGTEATSSLFYMIAIMYGGWFVGLGAGIALAALSVVAWIVSYRLVGVPFSTSRVLYWNVFAEISIYTITAVTVAQVKAGLARVCTLAERLEEVNRALDRETLAVGKVQREMLPERVPEIRGYRLDTLYLTSTRAGGDYYDFFPLPGDRVGIVVADASGHGAPAAVLMAMCRVLLHTEAEALEVPDRVLSRLNVQLVKTIPNGLFITACYVILDPATGSVEYSLAGHDSPLVVPRGDGSVHRLPIRGGPPLGLFATSTYESGSTSLRAGDTLVLHTDGLTELMSPTEQLFGEPRLLEALSESRAFDPAEMRRYLLAHIDGHRAGAPLSDDLTLLILRRLLC